jgi:hypothetical protein
MKPKITVVLSILLISMLITACSSNRSSSDVTIDNPDVNKITVTGSLTSIPTISPIVTKSEKYLAIEAYKIVLQKEGDFFSTEDNKKILLNDYLKEYLPEEQIELTHFTIIDMDDDNTPEVVLELSVDGYPESYEILHYSNEQVYGYHFVYRGLEQLKTDGTFWASNGAADNECDKLDFQNSEYETITLAYSESSQDRKGMTISYYVNNQPVTKESFDSFIQKQDAKDNVVWYELSKSNIEKELSVNE